MPFIGGVAESFAAGRRTGIITNIATLPNLQVWYDAADSTVFTPAPTNGSTFTQWSDKSAFAHNANSGSASIRPTYQTNVLNGKSVVRMDGVNDQLTINPATWAASLSGFTIYIVAKNSTISGTRTLTSTDQNGLKIYYNGTNWAVSTSGAIGTTTMAGDTTKFHTFGLIFDGTGSTNADKIKFRVDGTQMALSFTGTAATTTNAATSVINIGFYNSSEYFGGDIAEIILLSKSISGSDVAGIEEYLSNKWAI